jgi:hypothetical protein
VIAAKGVKAPIQAGKRWVIERTNRRLNDFGEVRRGFQRTRAVTEFFLYLAAALVTVRALIRQAQRRYRWENRPTARRLRQPTPRSVLSTRPFCGTS